MFVPDPTADTRKRVKAPVPDTADVVVIGAGLGGLLAAARLARAGASVAVFDHHYVAGGCGTMYKRGPADARYVFDIGMHYVGDAGPGGRIPAMLSSVGAHVSFRPLDPEGFDRIHVPGASFQVPWQIDDYEQALCERFPHETQGIRRYCRMVREVSALSAASLAAGGRITPRVIWTALTRGRMALRYQHATAATVVDACVSDPQLKAILYGINGCYAVAPRDVSAFMHFGLAAHYFRGGYYPRGGGQRMADALADAVEEAGGALCLRQGIAEIVVEDGRVAGVRLESGKVVRAPTVLSNACARKTLLELLPAEAVPRKEREAAERWEMSSGIHLLSLGVEGTPGELGIRNGNEWFHDTLDYDGLYDALGTGTQNATCLYITSGSAKDPGTPGHAPSGQFTLQAMVFVSGKPEHWGVTAEDVASGRYRSKEGYTSRKAALDAAILDKLERHYPGIGARIRFAESATPLSQARYTRASGGSPYGIAAIPSQFLGRRPGPVGPVPGLYLAGASTRSAHGIVGSLNSGWLAADHIAAARGWQVAPLENWVPGGVRAIPALAK
jgi:phytoene dehydrogenase-like protein